jgi:hypothetical protein
VDRKTPARRSALDCRRAAGAIDVGGTFTDLVCADPGSGVRAVHKVATTPELPWIYDRRDLDELLDPFLLVIPAQAGIHFGYGYRLSPV